MPLPHPFCVRIIVFFLKTLVNAGCKDGDFCVLMLTCLWFLLTGTRMQRRDAPTCLPARSGRTA